MILGTSADNKVHAACSNKSALSLHDMCVVTHHRWDCRMPAHGTHQVLQGLLLLVTSLHVASLHLTHVLLQLFQCLELLPACVPQLLHKTTASLQQKTHAWQCSGMAAILMLILQWFINVHRVSSRTTMTALTAMESAFSNMTATGRNALAAAFCILAVDRASMCAAQ